MYNEELKVNQGVDIVIILIFDLKFIFLLTLSAHAQLGVIVSVCLSVIPILVPLAIEMTL